MQTNIEKLRNELKRDPLDLKVRSELLHELVFSENVYSEEAKQLVFWFINNKPDYDGNWLEWRMCFID